MSAGTWYSAGRGPQQLISVVDHIRTPGRPPICMPGPQALIAIGVAPGVAYRWQRVRRDMTVGLRRRVAESRN